MKVRTEDLNSLAAAIAPLDTAERRETYRAGRFARSDKVRDLDKRYRWDLYWDCAYRLDYDQYEDLKDSHIDTALRALVTPL